MVDLLAQLHLLRGFAVVGGAFVLFKELVFDHAGDGVALAALGVLSASYALFAALWSWLALALALEVVFEQVLKLLLLLDHLGLLLVGSLGLCHLYLNVLCEDFEDVLIRLKSFGVILLLHFFFEDHLKLHLLLERKVVSVL